MKIDFVGTTYKFSISFFILYAFFMILLVSLGYWQLGRAEEKSVFLEKQRQSGVAEVLEAQALVANNAVDYRYRKVELTGYYDAQHQFLIDNQIVQGKAGYFIMTPFIVDGIKQAVLVNRGWLPLNSDRRILPDLSITTLKNHLTGRINHFPAVGLLLAGAEIPAKGWPSVVQVVDSQILSKKLAYPLLSFQIELDPEMQEGYLREWQEIKIMPVEKHMAYAVQWFGLAITLTLLFICFSRTVNE